MLIETDFTLIKLDHIGPDKPAIVTRHHGCILTIEPDDRSGGINWPAIRIMTEYNPATDIMIMAGTAQCDVIINAKTYLPPGFGGRILS